MEGRALEGMDMPFPFLGHAAELCFSRFPFCFVLIRVVLGLQDDSPSRRKHAAVKVELIGLEEEAAKDGQDCQVLAIGQVHDIRSGRHCDCSRECPVLSQRLRACTTLSFVEWTTTREGLY